MLSLALLNLALGALHVEGDSDRCPDATAVQAQIARLLTTAPPRNGGIRLHREGASLHILFLDENGEVLADRTLDANRPCEELVKATAVVIGAWSVSWPSRQAPPLELPQPPAPAIVVVAAPWVPPPAPEPHWFVEVGASLNGSVNSQGAVPAALIVTSIGRSPGTWAGQLTLLAEGDRRENIAGGTATWQREALALGPTFTLGQHRWSLELGAQGWLSYLGASGSGLNVDRTAAAVDPAIGLSARLSLHVGQTRIFLGVWPLYWLREEVVRVDNTSATQPLAQLEVLAGIGVDWLPSERFPAPAL